jgi:transcriptional regulator with XRE-family HTH domain
MPKLTVDYVKILELIPPGNTWADIGEKMGIIRHNGTRLGNQIKRGEPVMDTTIIQLVKAIGDLRGETLRLRDVLSASEISSLALDPANDLPSLESRAAIKIESFRLPDLKPMGSISGHYRRFVNPFTDAIDTFTRREECTHELMAELIGTNRPLVSQWKTGKASPGPCYIQKLEELFGIKQGSLFIQKFLMTLEQNGVRLPEFEALLEREGYIEPEE